MAIPVAAIASAIQAAAAIASNPETLNSVAELANSATKVIDAGAKTATAAAEAIAPVAEKAVSAGAEAGGKAKDAAGKIVSDATKMVGGIADNAVGAVKNAQEERARQKALVDARRQVLAGAAASMSASDFERDWEAACESGLSLPLKSPGYYAIATYKGKPGKDGIARYKDVYMARSEDMGASIHRHFTGGGNPDVFADVKYGQYVHVYAFPDFDDTDDNNETLKGFCLALGAYESYNASMAGRMSKGKLHMSIVLSQEDVQASIDKLGQEFENIALEERELCGDGFVMCELSLQAPAKAERE